MVHRPIDTNAFEFVVVSILRVTQLTRGCSPRVAASEKSVVTAQREVAEGKVMRVPAVAAALVR